MSSVEEATPSTSGQVAQVMAPSSFPPNKMDSILAEELKELSCQDRNRIQEEIHGVENMAVKETPELIQTSLIRLEHAIEALPPHKKKAYTLAISMNSRYVLQADFRLKFLRADLFDVKSAAERFMGYLDFTYEHFGTDVLMRPILQSDLSKLELELLRRGNNQVMPSRDRTGRLINVHQGAMVGDGITTVHRMRVMLYHFGAISDDLETQRKGLVTVCSGSREAIQYFANKDDQLANARFMATQPLRFSGMHISLPDDYVFNLMQALMVLDENQILSRWFDSGNTISVDDLWHNYSGPNDNEYWVNKNKESSAMVEES